MVTNDVVNVTHDHERNVASGVATQYANYVSVKVSRFDPVHFVYSNQNCN